MPAQFQYRPSEKRGGADHGWLKTFHTFSFADYYDPNFESFGCLRVINEDRVARRQGFPTHPHREAEIFSYIVDGELSHKDSMGNVETMVPGDVQMTSGGTGIAHSEYNDNKDKDVHFLQIWALPNARGLKPQYYTRHFPASAKLNTFAHVVGPVGAPGVIDEREAQGPTPIHAPLHFFAALIDPGKTVDHAVLPRLTPSAAGKGKLVYVQVVQTSGYNTKPAPKDGKTAALVKFSLGAQDVTLGEGDGVFVRDVKEGDIAKVENVSDKQAHVTLFEMDA